MFPADQYQLLDFGDCRKLERFGPYVLDRPCPAAQGDRVTRPSLWQEAVARFDGTTGDRGAWRLGARLPDMWTITHPPWTLELKPTDAGHLGVFAEHAENWDWIAAEVRAATMRVKVLNLFAYTGASTLAAAAAGAEVVHVDAAQSSVAWARRNAARSGLQQAPIRWITEDAPAFVRRELKRGNLYQGVILDPPSYGHGPKGEVWTIADQLPALLATCTELIAGPRQFVLLACHTTGLGPSELGQLLSETIGRGELTATQLTIGAEDGRRLPSGAVARWRSHGPDRRPARGHGRRRL